MIFDSTIAAIATSPGMGAIATIRISGPQAIEIADKVFKSKSGKKLIDSENYKLYFGEILSKEKLVDEVLISRFQAPHSYTGENSVEINCHGSVFIQQEILRLLIENGCSMATAGEFTKRAFINGKMDLSQAEAVSDLISSSSAGAHSLAMNQMKGKFSNEIDNLRAELLNFASLIELELDFSEEDVEFADRENLKTTVINIKNHMSSLADSFSTGNAIKNGVPVAIVGSTNAGKSTLLNALLKEDRAIVSNIHGTTRDVIEDTMVLQGTLFRFIDTAGIRETSDVIENLGIQRSYDKIEKAKVILWVIDGSDNIEKDINSNIKNFINKDNSIIILNKSDKVEELELILKIKTIQKELPEIHIVIMSAKDGEGIHLLEKTLTEKYSISDSSSSNVIVTNIRHYELLTKSVLSLERVMQGLNNNISGDFIAQDIRECINLLGEITGNITSQDILSNIFEHFCIGK